MAAATITISIKPCSSCGKSGAIEENKAGLCLSCINAEMAKNDYQIGIKQVNWPDDNVKFLPAPEVEAAARDILALVPEMEFRRAARVYYQFQREMADGVAGNCYRVPARLRDVLSYDFVITICWTTWRNLETAARQRVAYHELCHIGQTEDGEWKLLKHEFEGFVSEWTRFKDVIEGDPYLRRIFRQQPLALNYQEKPAEMAGATG